MSAPEELLNGQDPDYVSATSNDPAHQKIYEENARNTTAKKITAIIEKEFSLEIDLKEKEILQIQERLHKALKIFHLLRYIIITNFYNRKQCQISQAVETKQTRIHPAIKTLLGKSPKFAGYTDFAVPSTSTDPRFLYDDKSDASTAFNNILKIEENANKSDGASQGEKRKMLDEEFQPRKIPRYVPPKSSLPEKSPSRGNSHKVRKRIIVGNISKWIPPDWREDASSHKWTMYVRGDKDEKANISTFVSKVRFFLHPSYHPNDIVEITSYPFHLSRRGWGEFPLRVQLHFKNTLNKPMDIIHHLKLDRTYTGLQTLGSETLVDVWIHTAESYNSEQNNNRKSSINDTFVKLELNDSSESIDKQSEKFRNMSQPNIFKEIQVKKEIPDSEVHERYNSSLDLMLIKNSERIKTKSKDTLNTYISNDKHREAICHIKHDHNYFCGQYFNSRHFTVREGNITVEHVPENGNKTSINSTIDNNKRTSDIIVSTHRVNGDIQSSNNYQSLASSNIIINDSQVTSVNAAFQENNSQKDLLSDTDKSLQNSKSDTFRILETPSANNTVTAINGFRKSFGNSLDCFNNLQKTANSSETCNLHLKPLQISIPPNIIASSSKHILLLKDEKSVPVDFTNILPSKSRENLRMLVDGIKVSVPSVAKLNVPVSQGVSILKKLPNVKINAQQEDTVNNNKKRTALLKLKDTNSLLLNVNENVPILKIVDSHDSRYNYSRAEAIGGIPLIGKQEFVSCAKSENKTIVQRTKITLGKDKFKIQSKKDLYEAVLQSIDTANIADMEALIRFIIRRLPIVTQDVRDPDYRRLHPYACYSEEEYLSYNVGKQRAIEWYRAKMIRSFLQMKLILSDQLWSIKEIMLWARLHGYTPSQSVFGVQETAGTSDMKKLPDTMISTMILSTYTEPIALQKWLQTCQREPNRQSDNYINDEEIDVESIKECPRRITIDRRKNSSNKNSNCSTDSTLIPIELDENLLPFHNFVCDTAQEIGIKIEPEEIIPGVLYCAASRVIMQVVECFVEDLTRSSLAKAWERNNGNECPKLITLNDVRNALANREEFDIFTNEGLGSRQELNATNL
ncbi:YEATS domain-containing protein 2 [Trachymyrmex septentrionalis]|uniref:YEATS domain-containing protein 2 n=1 Tax=Trachymyrmex septentrionalis TaxID=34720 RepID=A0A195FSS5_9HYME|nr:PREDICTED: YEATS domain-containing protein 2 [Trachymyrmex septentrionalis]KYN43498.1 YEATS domain-containing protein 2 [Trachymyrmex septentrionalis]